MRWPVWRVAVAERSMEPSLRPGDWLLVWRGLRSAGALVRVKPDQIVVARHPGRPGMFVVKRAVRLEPGGWWLESDSDRPDAVDSRVFGPVPCGLIEGRVLMRYGRER